MAVREMKERDVEAVSAICIDSFSQSVAGTLPEEGVLTFLKIATASAFIERMKGDNLMFVAETGENIDGVIELKEGRHIAMLFVNPDCQRNGIGRMLLSSALDYVRVGTLTVKASLPSVPAYEKYGFVRKGGPGESEGLIYQPMEFELNKSMQLTINTTAD